MRVLTFTTLYPNAARPEYGVFVENRLRHLVESGEVSARVLAPVPYFPFRSESFGIYGAFARAPRLEKRYGIEIDHPRFAAIPRVGMTLAPFLLYASARRALARLLSAGERFDLIDAHYFYPDGVAAVMLGRAFGLPVTVTARGTDINLIPRYTIPRRLVRQAARRADGVIAVSSALAERLSAVGVERERITVLRNGVDPEVFRPVRPYQSAECEDRRLPLALSVGNLVPLKGHDLVIRAVAQIPELRLWIVGDGSERVRLEALAQQVGVAKRVRFLGVVAHERMPEIYSAAEVLVLASEREGWPNVLLEAMACGTRVITTRVSDVAELVNQPVAGCLVEERSVAALVNAMRASLAISVSRQETCRYARQFSWESTTAGQLALFRQILREHGVNGP